MNHQMTPIVRELKAQRKDVEHLRKDMEHLRKDTEHLRKDMEHLKTEVRSIVRDELKGFVTNEKFDRLAVEVVRHGHDIAELKPVVIEIRDIVRSQSDRMDAYAKDAARIYQNDRIHDGYIRELTTLTSDHEKRISTLESR
jgi:predicted RNase H-like nuclease (RuvC/YqgF family)